MRLANIRIGLRLTLCFSLLATLLIGMGLFSIQQAHKLGSITRKMYRHPYTVSNATRDIQTNIIAMHHATKDVALAQTPEALATALDAVDTYEKCVLARFATVNERFLGDTTQIKTAEKVFADWKPIRDEVIDLVKAGKNDQAATLTEGKEAAHLAMLTDSVSGLIDYANNKGKQFNEAAAQTASRTVVSLTSILGLSILFYALSAWIITRSLIVPLHTLWNGIAALGSGDLTVKMGLTAMDEIGEIARTLDKTVSSLHQLVRNIQDAAKQTSHSSEQLAASSRSISVGAQRQASAIEEIGQSIDVMSSSIQATAYKAEEATHVSDGTARIATKGNETVKQSVVAMSRINESSMQIGKIVSIISQISDQTNMLSINAAIEAAIAEQHGVCFAVVADEVGKLAERSSQATKEIAQLIDISKNRVSEGSCLSEKVGTALSEIIQGIERAAVGIADISTSTKQQTSTVINVSQSAENISSITEANCKEATEMAVRANELSEQAQHLQALTDMFKLDRV